MPDLELELRQLGAEIAYPPVPDVAGAVRRRLEGRPARRFAWRPNRRALALAVAVLAVGLAGVMAVPQARTSILEWLGIRGVEIEQVEELPEIPAAGDLGLGERLPLDIVEQLTGRRVLLPQLEGFGEPDEVYINRDQAGMPVSLIYGSGRQIRLLVTQWTGARILIEKTVAPETTAEPVVVNGGRGVWIEGALHGFMLRDEFGNPIPETVRLARNTLLWERGDVSLRLEGALSKEEALRIARSFR